MGEVRIQAKLTNALDEMLARRGQIQVAAVRSYIADAMVDMGAVRTVIPSFVAQQLGLSTPKQYVAEYADGRREAVPVTEPISIEILGRQTYDEAFVLGSEVLIGQTVLEKTDLHVDCANTRLVPNPDHPDQPVSKVK